MKGIIIMLVIQGIVVLIQNNNSGIFIMQQPQQDEQAGHLQLISNFVQAVKQQSLHADVLLYERQQFEALKGLVAEQQQKLKEYLVYQETNEEKANKNFRFVIYTSEIERLQYLLKMYLRTRLKKVYSRLLRSSSTVSIQQRTSNNRRNFCLPPR